MIDGNGNKWTTEKTDEKVIMPNNGITNVEIGNDGNGYARVTYLGIQINNKYKQDTSIAESIACKRRLSK